MQRCAVGLGIDRDRRDPHAPQRADDAAGDRAAVGDQDLVEHGHLGRVQSRPFAPSSRLYRPRPAAHRRRVVGVAGVVELRAVGDQHQHVHLGAHLDVACPGAEMPSSNVSSPSGVTGTFMKKLMLLGRSRLFMPLPVARQRQQEVVAAAVHVLLFQRVAHLVALGRAGAAQRVVAAAGVGDDRQQRPPFAGHQPRAGPQVEFALRADRVGRRCSARRGRGVEEQRVDRLVALEVDDAKDLAGLRALHPAARPAGSDDVDARAARVERAFHELAWSSRSCISAE